MSEQAPEAQQPSGVNARQIHACSLAAADLAHLDPPEIRQCVSDLLAAGRHALAQALGEAALARHPSEPNVLASAALLAQARHDWMAADDLLRRWVAVEGAATPPAAWHQWVHVLHQLGEPCAALNVVLEGSRCHPDHPGLAEERQALERRWERCQLMSAPQARH